MPIWDRCTVACVLTYFRVKMSSLWLLDYFSHHTVPFSNKTELEKNKNKIESPWHKNWTETSKATGGTN